jgi:hypothetical protein
VVYTVFLSAPSYKSPKLIDYTCVLLLIKVDVCFSAILMTGIIDQRFNNQGISPVTTENEISK